MSQTDDLIDDLLVIIRALTPVAEEGMSRSLNGYWDIHRWAAVSLTPRQFMMWKSATGRYATSPPPYTP